MKTPALSILVIEDDLGDRKLLRRAMGDSGLDCDIVEAETFAAALDRHSKAKFDFIIMDNGLPDGVGIDLIDRVIETWPTAGVALVTGLGNEDLAATAIKRGAVDYISKRNIDGPLMATVIENGVKVARLQEKIRSQNEALQAFARVLAHDLRSPLQAVRMIAETMMEDAAASKGDEIRGNAELMLQYSERLTDLIANLENYNRLDYTPKFEPHEADPLLDSAIENLEVEISANDVRIEREPLPKIDCIETEIVRLFQNLLANSIKYRSDEAPVIRIWASPATRQGRCTIHVADNGIGIPRDQTETVFQEFRRLHARRGVSGTGLGLSMCRRIVERHGGRIWCGPGQKTGTVFHFDLPLASQMQQDQTDDTRPDNGRKRTGDGRAA